MYKIEKGIPHEDGRGRRTVYPFAQMEVGDSFVVPAEKRAAIYACAYTYAARLEGEYKVASRVQENGTLRVWRIK